MLVVALAATLGGNALAGGYVGVGVGCYPVWGYHGYGSYCGGYPWWPGLAIGIGLGAICSSIWHSSSGYANSYDYPAVSYAYAPPTHGTGEAATQPATPLAPAVQEALVTKVWVPSSPGAGKWVPDATPYSYSPTAEIVLAKAAPVKTAPKVSVSRSAGGVPVYCVGP